MAHTHPKHHHQTPAKAQPDDETPAEKKFQRVALRLIGVMVAIDAVYYYAIGPETFGYDTRYTIFVWAAPTVAGMVALGWYRRAFLLDKFRDDKSWFYRLVVVIFYLVQGAIFSSLSFGQLARMGWDLANYQAAKNAPVTVVECTVGRFWTSKRPKVEFYLDGHFESIPARYSDLQPYIGLDPGRYKVRMHVQKGIWNYYTLKDWQIVKK